MGPKVREGRTEGGALLRRTAVAYLLAEAGLAGLWWGLLALLPDRSTLFTARGAPAVSLLAFAAGDAVLFAGAAAACAYGLWRKAAWAWPLLCVHAGAATYAALYCWSLTLLTGGEGLLGALAMSPALILPGLFAWCLRPGAEAAGGVVGRPAGPASNARNVGKTLAQTLGFWLSFLALFPALAWGLEGWLGLENWRFGSPAARGAGVALFVLGGVLAVTSGMVLALRGKGTPLPLDCPRELVIAGPYRYVRNPMAMGSLAQGVAVGLYLGSPAVIAYALAGIPAWDFVARPWEEADLEHRFGEAYRAYRASVRCWAPRLRGFSPPRSAGSSPDT